MNDFLNIFARTNLKAHVLEFEPYRVPPWADIRDKVMGSMAVFVLLGPAVRSNPYTQNWVAWEAGIACALNKPLWVYERVGEPVEFPVPYCTDYVLYDPAQREHLDYIRNVVESHDPTPRLIGLGLLALLGFAAARGPGAAAGAGIGLFLSALQSASSPDITCPYPTCGVKFRAHTPVPEFLCPSCRQRLKLSA